MDRQLGLRNRVNLCLDGLTDVLGVLLRIRKANQLAIITHAEQKLPAHRIGKSTDALEPTHRIVSLKHQFLVVRTRLTNVCAKLHVEYYTKNKKLPVQKLRFKRIFLSCAQRTAAPISPPTTAPTAAAPSATHPAFPPWWWTW